MQTSTLIRDINENEIKAAALTLARAFENDVLFNWLCRKDFTQNLACAFEKLMRNREKMCLMVRVINDGKGVAVIRKPPGKIKADFLTALSFLPDLFAIVGPIKLWRLIKMEIAVSNDQFKKPHAYLWYLGIDEASQGQGLGKAMVKSICADFETVFLQTSNPRNLKFYADLGFDVIKEVSLGAGAPNIWQFGFSPQK